MNTSGGRTPRTKGGSCSVRNGGPPAGVVRSWYSTISAKRWAPTTSEPARMSGA